MTKDKPDATANMDTRKEDSGTPHVAGACEATAGRNVRYGCWDGSYRLVWKNNFSGVLKVPMLPLAKLQQGTALYSGNVESRYESRGRSQLLKRQICGPQTSWPGHTGFPLTMESQSDGHAAYDAYWKKRIVDERLLFSHRAVGRLIAFQSYYHGVPLASLDRASPSFMTQRGLNPEKISALRAIERTAGGTRQERFDAYMGAARAIDANLRASPFESSRPTKPAAPSIQWSRPSTTHRRKRFQGVRIVRVALQDHTIRASQVAIAGLDSWVGRGAYSFTTGQSAMYDRITRMNQYVHPVASNSGLLSTLGVSAPGVFREWCALFERVGGFKGVRESDWDNLTAHLGKHVLIIRDHPVRPFFVAVAEGVTPLHIPRMALQLSAHPSWESGYDALCFEPPAGLTIPNRAEYFGTRNRELGENIPVVVDGVTSRADRATPYRVLKRDADYDSDDQQLSVPTR